jgi:hypothetical protein
VDYSVTRARASVVAENPGPASADPGFLL